MPDSEYKWWIDQKVRDKDGKVHVTRLLHYRLLLLGHIRTREYMARRYSEISIVQVRNAPALFHVAVGAGKRHYGSISAGRPASGSQYKLF
jgi:hypothetical protein